ncbi:putative diphthamide synthesis protein-domain-containing protein [Armillaria borealis]|uniref:2-(3-amino-3-carboxypropyl)histidine synthase subunit 1 n=1 Tax=Armillaria borealis TaxID=47425 RepID=A0AA39K709_9AGAR|nr:putative diphthamide synthesis protein-domain-containing protein [Armillaria borealis]
MADASAPRKRVRPRKFVGSTKAPLSSSSSSTPPLNSIPQSLLQNEALNTAISALPSNYSFEIHKTLANIQRHWLHDDIIERFSDALTVVLADVTYGACCALGCDLLVHYGHSCLVPVDVTTGIRTLYIFVEIAIDEKHLVETVRLNLPDTKDRFLENKESKEELAVGPPTSLALVSTIQFVSALSRLKESLSSPLLNSSSPNLWPGPYAATVPRSHPLSPGEILGCTAPRLPDAPDAFIYLGDGRFHLEAAMIANPGVPAFRYDPYSKKLTREGYDHVRMRDTRLKAVKNAEGKGTWGVILGTLGRQGNPGHLKAISVTPIPILLSELSPAKLALFNDSIDVFVQTSCPRLSIDWGAAFERPLLSVYESGVALGKWGGWWEDGEYPMDFYARGSRWVEARKNGEFITA